MADKLTEKQKMFVLEYLVDLNATEAAKRAGYSHKTAMEQGYQLLQKTTVHKAIQEAMEKRANRTEISADMVLQRWWDIATADPNEIIHLRRVCCRHCYGIDYQYQWRDKEEYQRAIQAAINNAEEDKPPVIPSDAGGYGFNKLLRPHAECPYCKGEGSPEIHIEDTRDLKPKAKLLYAGIKQTQAGIEIKFKDQDKALENVARHLGMFTDKMELTGKDGGPIKTRVDLSGLTLEELRAIAKSDSGTEAGAGE